MIKDIIKMLKVNHYIKNFIVFLPLIFSHNLNNIEKTYDSIVIFISFCFISSATYILNDLKDKNSDVLHPEKRLRPIASGKISTLFATCSLIVLSILSCLLAGSLNLNCLAIIFIYFGLNILYTFWLKQIEIVDVLCIALGFILRVLSGCEAINVIASPLVILLTFFMSMFFTFMKRKLELQLQGENTCRNSIKKLNIETLNHFILINAILSISFYITYVLDSKTIDRTGTELLYITVIPFTMILLRLILLTFNSEKHYDPINFIYKDTMTKVFLLLYLITLLVVS